MYGDAEAGPRLTRDRESSTLKTRLRLLARRHPARRPVAGFGASKRPVSIGKPRGPMLPTPEIAPLNVGNWAAADLGVVGASLLPPVGPIYISNTSINRSDVPRGPDAAHR